MSSIIYECTRFYLRCYEDIFSPETRVKHRLADLDLILIKLSSILRDNDQRCVLVGVRMISTSSIRYG